MKYSWQRQIILETIQEHKEHLSAQQIYGYARERTPPMPTRPITAPAATSGWNFWGTRF